jgi:hypothetical protein
MVDRPVLLAVSAAAVVVVLVLLVEMEVSLH